MVRNVYDAVMFYVQLVKLYTITFKSVEYMPR
jgi:hypothetical protein